MSVVELPSSMLVDSRTTILINLGDRPAQQPKPIPITKFALSLRVVKRLLMFDRIENKQHVRAILN